MNNFPIVQLSVADIKTPEMQWMDAFNILAQLNCPKEIPWPMIAPHAEQAELNHDQTLERLAERGGLSPCEAVAILENREWHRMDLIDSMRQLKLWLSFYEREEKSKIVIYKGKRGDGGCSIVVGECGGFDNLIHCVKHSPTGMEWGYGGSGPADTAYSILRDYFQRTSRDPLEVENLYQQFKWKFISGFKDNWELTGEQIEQWLEEIVND